MLESISDTKSNPTGLRKRRNGNLRGSQAGNSGTRWFCAQTHTLLSRLLSRAGSLPGPRVVALELSHVTTHPVQQERGSLPPPPLSSVSVPKGGMGWMDPPCRRTMSGRPPRRGSRQVPPNYPPRTGRNPPCDRRVEWGPRSSHPWNSPRGLAWETLLNHQSPHAPTPLEEETGSLESHHSGFQETARGQQILLTRRSNAVMSSLL